MERTLDQVSRAIASSSNTNVPRYEPMWGLLLALAELETRPPCLTEMAYQWCIMVWESFGDWAWVFLYPLEIGFRHLDPSDRWIRANLTHVEHDQNFVNKVFENNKDEAIADLLQALTIKDIFGNFARTSLSFCARHIIGLHNTVTEPFSPRLRRLVIRSVELLCREGFKEVEPGSLVGLLNHLRIGIEDMDWPYDWTSILGETIQSTEGARQLDILIWELLTEVATSNSRTLAERIAYDSHVIEILLDAQEWEKLECWLGVVWMTWLPETYNMTEDLQDATKLLFRQKPDAVRKLTQWMERWSQDRNEAIPETFQQICEQARLDAA